MPDTVIVFSHLRWDFVYQRPQHLMSRLAENHKVIFFEEPVRDDSAPFVEERSPQRNVTVCRPHTPCRQSGFHDDQFTFLRSLLKGLIKAKEVESYLLWFYTPMALPLAEELSPAAIIYDCMDELSGFLNAPPQLVKRESALLKMADVVFTGGPSLFRAKRMLNPSVHCFPSSVDTPHFAAARKIEIDHLLQAEIPRPRLGYFGVIDERVDLGLLDALSSADPEWQIIMVGPVIKIDPASLPRRPNIHYLGQQEYSDLPTFVGGWDVCLIPFALNEATRFISPTKTLEYMAAGKQIVSTAIQDVAEPYGDLVFIGSGSEGFVDSCRTVLGLDLKERERRLEGMGKVLERTSWTATVLRMQEEIVAAISRRRKGQQFWPTERIAIQSNPTAK